MHCALCTLCFFTCSQLIAQCLVFNVQSAFLITSIALLFPFFLFAMNLFGPFFGLGILHYGSVICALVYIFPDFMRFFLLVFISNGIFYGIWQSKSAKIKHFRLLDDQKIKTAGYVNVYNDMSNYFAVWISFTFFIK